MVEFLELQKHSAMFDICGKCGDCGTSGTQISTAKRHISKPCPVKNIFGFEAYNARGRILVMKNLLENNCKINDDIIDWAYTCTQCASCRETCLAIEGGINTPLFVEALRQDLVSQGYFLKKHKEILNNLEQFGNPYGINPLEKAELLKLCKQSKNPEYLLYLGCTNSYKEQKLAEATITLLNLIEVPYQVIDQEPCCGSILKRYGYMDEFTQLANRNIELFKSLNIKKVIFPCAGCFRTYKHDYISYNSSSIEFYHLTEFLDDYLKKHPSSFKLKTHSKITYHDPCHLGRHAGVYEAPRTLLKQIKNSTFIELDNLRNFSHCCGAGGGVKSSNPDLALKIAQNRISEVIDKGIEILVSACPFCERNFKEGLKEINLKDDLKVLDISELLLESYEKELQSSICTKNTSCSEITTQYMQFLSQYPDIFSDLVENSVLDFAIYNSFKDLEAERPLDVFHVIRILSGIEIYSGKSDDADLELALSRTAVEKLIKKSNKKEYAKEFGEFYNEPDEESGWIDFILHKRTKTLIDMGYGKFAVEAGILEDEKEVSILEDVKIVEKKR